MTIKKVAPVNEQDKEQLTRLIVAMEGGCRWPAKKHAERIGSILCAKIAKESYADKPDKGKLDQLNKIHKAFKEHYYRMA